jgi:hypothetical protein
MRAVMPQTLRAAAVVIDDLQVATPSRTRNTRSIRCLLA